HHTRKPPTPHRPAPHTTTTHLTAPHDFQIPYHFWPNLERNLTIFRGGAAGGLGGRRRARCRAAGGLGLSARDLRGRSRGSPARRGLRVHDAEALADHRGGVIAS